MTIKDLKNMIKKLPPDMEVVIFSEEEYLSSACKENSEIIEAEIDGHKEKIFLIVPCSCSTKSEFNLN